MNWRTSKLATISVLLLLMGLLTAGSALAAEFSNQETYRLGTDEVVTDDLYVTGNEVYIDGVVEGDLFVAGNYIEINGTVEGDLMAAGASILVLGTVGDDARLAGAGIEISGNIGDDLFMAGGGGPNAFDFPMQQPSIPQGVRLLNGGTVGGDAHVAGGGGTINGTIAGNLRAAMGFLTLGAEVGGDADLFGENIQVLGDSSIAGTLSYTSPERLSGLDQNADDVVYNAPEVNEQTGNPIGFLIGWVLRTIMMLIGFGILAWLLMRFAPNALTAPAKALADSPVETGLYGLIAAVLMIFIPVISGFLVFLTALFLGGFEALVVFVFLFGFLALIWFVSPLITGKWLGERIAGRMEGGGTPLTTLLIGVSLIILLGRIPILGWLVYLVSFVLAVGALIRAIRSGSNKSADGPSGSGGDITEMPSSMTTIS